eukprot:COSAG01_NODE_16457_length_1235_cov_3.811620_2_plen_74_part_00
MILCRSRYAELGCDAYAGAVTNLAWQGGLELPADDDGEAEEAAGAEGAKAGKGRKKKKKAKKKKAKKKKGESK